MKSFPQGVGLGTWDNIRRKVTPLLIKIWKEFKEQGLAAEKLNKQSTKRESKVLPEEKKELSLQDKFNELVKRLKKSNGQDHQEFLNFVVSLNDYNYRDCSVLSNTVTNSGPWGTKIDVNDRFYLVPANTELNVASYSDFIRKKNEWKKTEQPVLFVETTKVRYNGGSGTEHSYKFGDDNDWKKFTEESLDNFANKISKLIESNEKPKEEEKDTRSIWYIDYMEFFEGGDVAHVWVRANSKEEAIQEAKHDHWDIGEIINVYRK